MAKKNKLILWAALGVGAWWLFGRSSTAAAASTTDKSAAPPARTVTVHVGDTIVKPTFPPLPAAPTDGGPGYAWSLAQGWDAGPPGWLPVVVNPDGTFTATKPGQVTLPFELTRGGGGVGGPVFRYVVNIVP
jgi:hypothetical protein